MSEDEVFNYNTVIENPYVDITDFDADYVLHITEDITDIYYYVV